MSNEKAVYTMKMACMYRLHNCVANPELLDNPHWLVADKLVITTESEHMLLPRVKEEDNPRFYNDKLFRKEATVLEGEVQLVDDGASGTKGAEQSAKARVRSRYKTVGRRGYGYTGTDKYPQKKTQRGVRAIKYREVEQ